MNSPIFYTPAPIIDAEGELTTTAVHNATRVDLQTTPWRNASALVLTVKTTNHTAPLVALYVNYAFSFEEIAPGTAVTRLAARKGTLNANLGETGGGVLEYATEAVPITGRYLYVWWTAAANDNGEMDMEVHAIPAA